MAKAHDWKPAFLKELADTANVTGACEKAGIVRQTAYHAKERNSKFAEAWQDALEAACDKLEKEAWRRAHDGTDKPVTYQGAITDTYREYSDTLLIFLLKAHRPDKYRDHQQIELTGGSKPILVSLIWPKVELQDNSEG